MRVDRSGVTRLVLLTRRHAIKVPRVRFNASVEMSPSFVRGWLANRSEWKQRRRMFVASPIFTLGHVVLVMPRGEWDARAWYTTEASLRVKGYDGDEAKPSSWRTFPDGIARLVDFDRAWEHPRGLVGGWYYGRQEAMARRWIAEGARAE